MASAGERVLSLALTLLVVSSAVSVGFAPSPVGTASAQLGDGSGGACEASDWFLTFVSGTLLTTDCKTAPDVAEEWNESAADQTRTQIHSQAGQLSAGNEQFLTAMSNAVTDSDTIAFSKGEAAAVEVLANGGTISEAQQAANESIEDYYATKQLNLLDRWNVGAETVYTLSQQAENTTGVDSDYVTFGEDGDFGDTLDGGNLSGSDYNGVAISKTETEPVTLVNSTTASHTSLRLEALHSFSYSINLLIDGQASENKELSLFIRYHGETFSDPSSASGSYGIVNVSRVAVRQSPNLTSRTAMNLEEHRSNWEAIETKNKQTKREVAAYINQSLAPAVQNGELDAQNYVSPATLAQEYAQEYGNDSSYIRATAIATYSGMDTPDLNNTGSMTISYNGSTYQGLLLSQEAPSGGWQSGQSYEPSLLSGLQMFAVAGDNGTIIQLDKSFTVKKVTGSDGQEIDKATTINVTYETSNASANYTELQQQIRSLNEQIQERQAQATGGTSDTTTNDGLLSKLAALLGVSSGVAVLVVAGVAFVGYRVYVPDP